MLLISRQVNLPAGPGPDGYRAVLARWREAWNALRVHTEFHISEINSIHIINEHLEEQYDLTGESLVKKSDHTIESEHQNLAHVIRVTNSWVKDITSEAHGLKFYRCVMTVNCYVMEAMCLRV